MMSRTDIPLYVSTNREYVVLEYTLEPVGFLAQAEGVLRRLPIPGPCYHYTFHYLVTDERSIDARHVVWVTDPYPYPGQTFQGRVDDVKVWWHLEQALQALRAQGYAPRQLMEARLTIVASHRCPEASQYYQSLMNGEV